MTAAGEPSRVDRRAGQVVGLDRRACRTGPGDADGGRCRAWGRARSGRSCCAPPARPRGARPWSSPRSPARRPRQKPPSTRRSCARPSAARRARRTAPRLRSRRVATATRRACPEPGGHHRPLDLPAGGRRHHEPAVGGLHRPRRTQHPQHAIVGASRLLVPGEQIRCVEVGEGVEHRHIDHATAARRAALDERRQRRLGDERRRHLVGDVRRNQRRFVAERISETGRVLASVSRTPEASPSARSGRIPTTRAHTRCGHRSRTVSASSPNRSATPGRQFVISTSAASSSVCSSATPSSAVRSMARLRLLRLPARKITPPSSSCGPNRRYGSPRGRLDLDHLGAEVGEDQAGERARDVARCFDDVDPREWAHLRSLSDHFERPVIERLPCGCSQHDCERAARPRSTRHDRRPVVNDEQPIAIGAGEHVRRRHHARGSRIDEVLLERHPREVACDRHGFVGEDELIAARAIEMLVHERSIIGHVRRIGHPGWTHTVRSVCSQTRRIAARSRASCAA